MKNSFVLTADFYEAIKDLTDTQIGKLHRAIYIYLIERRVIDLEPALAMAFKFVKVQLDKQYQEHIEISNKNKKNISKRWNKEKDTKNTSGINGINGIPNIPSNTKDTSGTSGISGIPNIPNNTKEEKEEKKEKEKERTKEKDIYIINNKKEKKEEKLPQTKMSVSVKPLNSQQRVYEYFAGKYFSLTGIKYLPKRSEFINLTELIHSYGEDMVKQKIDWLLVSCMRGVFWFAKEKNNFTIGTLRKHWNEIIPILTEEQKKQQEEKIKEEQLKKRVFENLRKMKEDESGVSNRRAKPVSID